MPTNPEKIFAYHPPNKDLTTKIFKTLAKFKKKNWAKNIDSMYGVGFNP